MKKEIRQIKEELPDITMAKDIPKIFSREDFAKQNPFPVINNEKLRRISQELKAANAKIQFLSSGDTQTTRKLMTLQMLQTADSTYRVLRQILATIERRQQAIAEAYAKLKQQYGKILKLQIAIEETDDDSERLILEGRIEQQRAGLANTISYLENAIKEVGSLTDAYRQILKNKNISEDWDEQDLEQDEIKAHIRSAFRNAIRDFLVHNAIGMGTCEYLEQFGISPVEAIYHVKNYLAKCNQQMQQGELPDYDNFHDFLNEMAEQYKDAYKKAMRRLGLDELLTKDYLQIIGGS